METEFITFSTLLEKEECGYCGGIYAISNNFIERRKEKGGSWYCPYCGSKWHFTKTEIQKLEEKLQNTKNLLACEISRHDQTKASLNGYKSANTRLKNRASKGICPCCNRYFENLHKHMETKHPNYLTIK